MRTTDICIKSYAPDYPWLVYCMRSIAKFCTGFNQTIVMMPRKEPLAGLTAEVSVLLDTEESYKHQQVAKLNADHHTQADYLVYVDSDMVFTRPVTPDFFFHDGKPIWVVSPWASIYRSDEKRAWYHVMAKCLQEAPPYEFMRKCAVVVPRHVLAGFRAHIEKLHGCSMDHYVVSQPGNEFSEYNCLGFYCWLYHRDEFHWHDTSIDGIPAWPWKQYWSWGGLKPDIRAELDQITGDSMHRPNDITTLQCRTDVGDWLNQSGLTGEGVEVGVQCGINAAQILSQWKGKLWLVDPWKKWDQKDYIDGTNLIDFELALRETRDRMKPYLNYEIFRATSDEAFESFSRAEKRFDFVHLDGNHHQPQVGRDIEQWWTLVRSGGLFSGHDYLDLDTLEWKCEVKSVLTEWAAKKGLPIHVTNEARGWPAWWIIKP